jgi:hypothetical protein
MHPKEGIRRGDVPPRSRAACCRQMARMIWHESGPERGLPKELWQVGDDIHAEKVDAGPESGVSIL